MIVFAVCSQGLVSAAGITSTPLFDKTDKTKPMGAFVSTLNPLIGQPEERGASPLLYAAASPELDGTHRHMAYLKQLWLRIQHRSFITGL